MPARAPASIVMLQIVMRASIDSASMADPRYSTMWPWPPPVPIFAMSARITSLAVSAGRQLAVHGHRHRPKWTQRERLGGQHVLDLAGPDAEGECAERAMRAGVRVAADDRHPGLGEPELRADDVHDALLAVAHRVQPDAELGAVAAQRLHLGGRDRVGDRQLDADGRHVVVLGGDGELGPAHGPAGHPQPVERLRAGHLVHEVQVDVEQVGLALGPPHQVRLPQLLGQGAGHVARLISHCGTSILFHGTA